MFIVKRFFFVGINPKLLDSENKGKLIQNPLILASLMVSSALLYMAVMHYFCVYADDIFTAIDSLNISCQGIICLFKMGIFLYKRKKFISLVSRIKRNIFQAKSTELEIIRTENAKDVFSCTIYYAVVTATGILSLLEPFISMAHIYMQSNELKYIPPQTATYIWDYNNIQGYTIVYIWNVMTVHILAFGSVAMDSLFSWFVCNIVAQFRIVVHRFQQAAILRPLHLVDAPVEVNAVQEQAIIESIKMHIRTMNMVYDLNDMFGDIIFVKFIISGVQISSLTFCLILRTHSVSNMAYLFLFLSAVAIQLMLYCYNGQRIADESLRVASEIYGAFEWSHLAKSTKKLLMMPMMRSQKQYKLIGVFFTVDLNLYLWVIILFLELQVR
ncbi:odorant receptor 45a-like isoform X2 [Haematobia irritans]|uniref:odorant receptor 45a-like isoform X2 n=1 Tax=Haematobia irritans TaxID=7368 RepID=UPI003F5008B0